MGLWLRRAVTTARPALSQLGSGILDPGSHGIHVAALIAFPRIPILCSGSGTRQVDTVVQPPAPQKRRLISAIHLAWLAHALLITPIIKYSNLQGSYAYYGMSFVAAIDPSNNQVCHISALVVHDGFSRSRRTQSDE
ncbi:hypothetical protein BO86DRAFT_127685 [Aspergillus japonicus CBS 114.51]|uniref:Uncharacterized protein n=1 Tax=Aspergillus japonicus CBS 114.51 TaxID=1448312 RepID=A0A8T8WY55_ASPJA|nr:hypothetical protein BO86DRAFT_127685 [Aspergillus japonicus CBS 114.51]RAH80332.1 hypothetical protein BO86DRAFT_127685 [Aspergillus japonicus CBS 114.51]